MNMAPRSILLSTLLLGCFIIALSAPVSKAPSSQSESAKNSNEFVAYKHRDNASKVNSTVSGIVKNITKSQTFQDYLQEEASPENNIQIELLNSTGKERLFKDDPLDASADGTDPDQAKSWWSKIFDVILIVVVELIGPMIS